jgi:hypothetical protein
VEAGDHQPFVFQLAQGFAHRRARHAQALGQLLVADDFVRRQDQADDPLLQCAIDLCARQRAGNGGGGVGDGHDGQNG